MMFLCVRWLTACSLEGQHCIRTLYVPSDKHFQPSCQTLSFEGHECQALPGYGLGRNNERLAKLLTASTFYQAGVQLAEMSPCCSYHATACLADLPLKSEHQVLPDYCCVSRLSDWLLHELAGSVGSLLLLSYSSSLSSLLLSSSYYNSCSV